MTAESGVDVQRGESVKSQLVPCFTGSLKGGGSLRFRALSHAQRCSVGWIRRRRRLVGLLGSSLEQCSRRRRLAHSKSGKKKQEGPGGTWGKA